MAHDGSEDERIHVFKPSGQIPEGFQLLSDARILAREAEMCEEPDTEQDDENGYIDGDDEIEMEEDEVSP